LDASGWTRQPKYNLSEGAALRSLPARARHQTISAFEPLILLRSPLTNFGWTPRTKCKLRKFGMGSDSPHQNWEFGKGIPSARFGAGIGNARSVCQLSLSLSNNYGTGFLGPNHTNNSFGTKKKKGTQKKLKLANSNFEFAD